MDSNEDSLCRCCCWEQSAADFCSSCITDQFVLMLTQKYMYSIFKVIQKDTHMVSHAQMLTSVTHKRAHTNPQTHSFQSFALKRWKWIIDGTVPSLKSNPASMKSSVGTRKLLTLKHCQRHQVDSTLNSFTLMVNESNSYVKKGNWTVDRAFHSADS